MKAAMMNTAQNKKNEPMPALPDTAAILWMIGRISGKLDAMLLIKGTKK